MGPLDALWHLANLFLPGIALGMLAAAMVKLLWRRELTGVSWRRLAGPAAAAAAAMTRAGLVLFGRDGKMATYAAMGVACAFMLWWWGWGPGRK